MYNWASVPGGDIPAGKKFYPMLWGADAGHTNSWNEDATAAIAAGADTLLGYVSAPCNQPGRRLTVKQF